MNIFRYSLMFSVAGAKDKLSNSHEICFKRKGYFLDGHQTSQQKNGLRIL